MREKAAEEVMRRLIPEIEKIQEILRESGTEDLISISTSADGYADAMIEGYEVLRVREGERYRFERYLEDEKEGEAV